MSTYDIFTTREREGKRERAKDSTKNLPSWAVSWLKGCFRHQKSAVRTQSSAKFILNIVNCIEQTKKLGELIGEYLDLLQAI